MNMLHASNQTNPGAVTTADTRGDSFARVSAGDLKRLNEQLPVFAPAKQASLV